MIGTLKVWKHEAGYGFITPDQPGQDVFVHVSSLQKAKVGTPAIGDRFSYEEGEGRNGKRQAINVALV